MPPSRSKAADAEEVKRLAAAVLEHREYQLVRMPEILHDNLTGGKPNLAVFNVCGMAKIALEKGMVQSRFQGDTEAAIATFRRGSDAVVPALESILPRTQRVSGGAEIRAEIFFNPFFCGLLAGDWQAVEKVAAMLHGPMFNPDETLHDGLMRIYSALAREDDQAYQAAREWTRRKIESPSVTVHKLHVQIADAVSAGDQAALDGLLAEAIATFPARGKRRTPGMLYGFGRDDNKIVLDFIAVGLAKIATRRGLSVDADSAVLPRALVAAWRQ